MTTPRPCPICGKPRQAEHAPFCSPRCRDRDLMRWLEDGYAIPGRPQGHEDDDESPV
jgi:uncharacterized protein